MANVNKIILMGSMYKIKKIETKSGKSMVSFFLRTYEKFGEKEMVTFFNCTAYSKLADIIVQYGADKKEAYVEGRVDMYKDKDGVDSFGVIVEELQFTGSKVA